MLVPTNSAATVHRRRRAPRDIRSTHLSCAVPSIVRPGSYDALGRGGTTTLEVRILHDGEGNVADVELLQEFVSLSGTHVNCVGGPTPWGSWLSCEETTEGAPQGRLAEGWASALPTWKRENRRTRALLGARPHQLGY